LKVKIKNFFGAINYTREFFEGVGAILMLHRVVNSRNGCVLGNSNLEIQVDELEKVIQDFKKRGYTFVSLDEVSEILKKKLKYEKFACITLDDGYLDNYLYAYPLFKKFDIPFAIYLATSFPNKTATLWWFMLEQVIIPRSEIFCMNGEYHSIHDLNSKKDVFLKIRAQLIKKNVFDIREWFFKNFEVNDRDWLTLANKYCLNWQNVEALAKDDLCTFGGHTVNHLAMRDLTIQQVIDEVTNANTEIQNHTGERVLHFCYPFGGRAEVGRREVEIISQLKLKTATTTRSGPIFMEHNKNMFALPRIMIDSTFKIETLGWPRKKRIVTL
jgi:peptidoglycan/xylan/chitin deacetylase (PgdA/CDA1 family)